LQFKYQLVTTKEIKSLKQYCLIEGVAPWDPSSFSGQFAGKFYQQVVDNEQENMLKLP
jgi:hypothetical protein